MKMVSAPLLNETCTVFFFFYEQRCLDRSQLIFQLDKTDEQSRSEFLKEVQNMF